MSREIFILCSDPLEQLGGAATGTPTDVFVEKMIWQEALLRIWAIAL
jgi:hypothetical protein